MSLARQKRRARMTFVAILVGLLAFAGFLMVRALDQTLTYFVTPADLAEQGVVDGQRYRLGGLVADDSVQQGEGATVMFRVTDGVAELNVVYTGILPDLFREGQGVVAEGLMQDGVFVAETVLAKHDETYMPPEVAEALKERGQWQGQTP